jgi:Na+/melibiose symporter-like transporter
MMDVAASNADGKKTWRVGTLVYDRKALFNVFFWMLWGDFCLNLMDSGVGSNIATILLDQHGASRLTIGLVTGTGVQIIATIMVVIISTASDRHRGWLGRRMPFMLWATPPLAIFLALTGFSPQISAWLQAHLPGLLGGLSTASVFVCVFSAFYLGYQFCDTFPQSVYYYLWTDVIPHELMGTFASLFRMCATAGTLLFNKYLLEHIADHPGPICLLAAGLYLVTFVLLCFMVKEGQYPAPEPAPQGKPLERLARAARRYARECYSLSYYWKYYLFNLCFMCGFVPFRNFLLLFGQRMMGMHDYKTVMVQRDLLQIGVFFLVGPVIDRFHPIRAGLLGYALMAIAALGGAKLIAGPTSFTVCVLVTFAAVAVYQGATGALGPRLLPKEQYGQFCSANAMIWHIGLMALTPTCGLLMDKFGDAVIFGWFFAFSSVGIVMLYLVYREWQELGGDEDYRAPVVYEHPPSDPARLAAERV